MQVLGNMLKNTVWSLFLVSFYHFIVNVEFGYMNSLKNLNTNCGVNNFGFTTLIVSIHEQYKHVWFSLGFLFSVIELYIWDIYFSAIPTELSL